MAVKRLFRRQNPITFLAGTGQSPHAHLVGLGLGRSEACGAPWRSTRPHRDAAAVWITARSTRAAGRGAEVQPAGSGARPAITRLVHIAISCFSKLDSAFPAFPTLLIIPGSENVRGT